ncbi:MAG: hypothetical protein ABR520_05875 [Mycobacteriales bacterium]|nr:hypothetical protein [Frankia sp.]
MIPLPVILTEFLLAFGAALLLANAAAMVRLRRDGNWPPAPPGSSRGRILASATVGLVVSLWALATLLSRYSL